MKVDLVEEHIIKKTHKDYEEADNLCFLSKNLYNSTNYAIRQHYFKTKKYLSYEKVNKDFTDNNQVDYRALPAKVAKGTQRKVDRNWVSFFKAIKKYKENPSLFNGCPRPPKYLAKDGRCRVHYEKGALSFVKKGYIKLSKTNIYIKTKLTKEEIVYVDIIPRDKYIKYVVGYTKEVEEKEGNGRYASIDLGVNNLATITSNVFEPYIINGKPLKSINQYANKKNAEYSSRYEENKEYYRKKKDKLWMKRNNKVRDYMHKASTKIVNYIVSKDVRVLVIGKNKEWKQSTKLGKVNNQNFVGIPFNTFIQMLSYKCGLVGIKVELVDESYSSKASFIDKDEVPTYKKGSKAKYSFSGRRVKRGLYKSKEGKKLNADVNGSLNILRKYLVENEAWNDRIWLDLVEQSSNETIQKYSLAYS